MTTNETKQHVQQPRLFNQTELDALIEKEQARYKGSHAACYKVNEPILQLYTKEVIRLIAEGYTLNEGLPTYTGPGLYISFFNKPDAMLTTDLQNIATEVEAKYKAEIESFNNEQENILADQLYQAQKKKEEEAAHKKDQGLRDKAAAEAKEYIQSVLNKEIK